MSRSLFDPSGDEMLDEGSSPFTVHSAQSLSHMRMTPIQFTAAKKERELRVPLIGSRAAQSLGPEETDALARAAQEALFKAP